MTRNKTFKGTKNQPLPARQLKKGPAQQSSPYGNYLLAVVDLLDIQKI